MPLFIDPLLVDPSKTCRTPELRLMSFFLFPVFPFEICLNIHDFTPKLHWQ